MRTSILIIALLFILTRLSAQEINLISNPSFEILSQCPDNTCQIDRATNWFGAHSLVLGGSSELYSLCSSQWVNAMNNGTGSQFPKNGQTFAGIHVTFGGSGHSCSGEKLEVGLLDSLQRDSLYELSFWVSNAENSGTATNGFQAYFTKDSFFVNKNIMPLSNNSPL